MSRMVISNCRCSMRIMMSALPADPCYDTDWASGRNHSASRQDAVQQGSARPFAPDRPAHPRALADNQDHHPRRWPLWTPRGDGLVRGQRSRLRFRTARQQASRRRRRRRGRRIIRTRRALDQMLVLRKRITPPNPGRSSVASALASKQRSWGWISATSSPTSSMARPNISTRRSIARADRWKI